MSKENGVMVFSFYEDNMAEAKATKCVLSFVVHVRWEDVENVTPDSVLYPPFNIPI